MIVPINVQIDEEVRSCFDCPFAKKEYCYSTCPFLDPIYREDGEPIPKKCPLKNKNRNKIYKFNYRK